MRPCVVKISSQEKKQKSHSRAESHPPGCPAAARPTWWPVARPGPLLRLQVHLPLEEAALGRDRDLSDLALPWWHRASPCPGQLRDAGGQGQAWASLQLRCPRPLPSPGVATQTSRPLPFPELLCVPQERHAWIQASSGKSRWRLSQRGGRNHRRQVPRTLCRAGDHGAYDRLHGGLRAAV